MAHMTVGMQLPAMASRSAIPGTPSRIAPLAARPQPQAAQRLASRVLTVANAAAGEFKDAEKRWNSQLAEGKVRNVTAGQAVDLVKEGWTLLDVRPPEEIKKAGLKDAVEVPIFVVEERNDIESLLKKGSAFGMGGWWEGGSHLKGNQAFMREVQRKVPKDAKVILACQKGLRSLAAAEQLSRGGYQTLAWINGGLDTAGKDTLETASGVDLRYGGVGGVSQMLGWTDVQRAEDKEKGIDRGSLFIKIGGAVLLADALLFVWEFFQAWQNGGSAPSALH